MAAYTFNSTQMWLLLAYNTTASFIRLSASFISFSLCIPNLIYLFFFRISDVKFHVSGDYYPMVYVNDYWNLNSDYTPINESTP